MATKNTKRLQTLSGSDFELGKNQPDIRGWEVTDPQGRKIGEVSELILDAVDHKVRYLVVNVLDSRELDLDKRTVMVPIGLAQLHPRHKDVVLHGVNPFQLRALPSYRKEELGAKAELAIATVFGRQYTTREDWDSSQSLQQDFYQHEHFLENRQGPPHPKDSFTATQPTEASRRLSEAEQASLQRDAELGQPLAASEEARLREQRLVQEQEALARQKLNKGQGPTML